MTAGRVANEYSIAGVVPYTANSITISPIPQGTFVNSTHICSTFLCAGCINSDSFDPPADGSNPEVFFGYAYSQTPVDDPSDIDTRLSDHLGKDDGSGGFRVRLGDARSDDYDRYVELAGGGRDGVGKDGAEPERPHPSTPSPSPTPTPSWTPSPNPTMLLPPVATSETGDGCWKDECVMPDGPDYSHRDMPLMELILLLVVGLIYAVRAFMS